MPNINIDDGIFCAEKCEAATFSAQIPAALLVVVVGGGGSPEIPLFATNPRKLHSDRATDGIFTGGINI